MPLFTVNADLRGLTDAVKELTLVARELVSVVRGPDLPASPAAGNNDKTRVSYYDNEKALQQEMDEYKDWFRGSPRALQHSIMRDLGYAPEDR